MITVIKGMTLRKENELPFLTKLIDTSSIDSDKLEIGSIITIKNGRRYKVIDILYIDLINGDIELLVEEVDYGS